MSIARRAAFLLMATAAVLAPGVAGAQAQTPPAHAAAAAPVIEGVEVNADAALAPGSTLEIAVRATPRARTSVMLPGGEALVSLRESEPGIYRGNYTVRRTDRIDPEGPIRASVAAGPRTTTASYRFPASFRDMATAAAKPVLPLDPAPAHAPSAPQSTSIMGASAPAAAPLVLQVTRPSSPAQVARDTGLLIEGRTAPNALVRARIDAVPPRAPGRASVAQIVMEETIQADADGRFRIRLGPQRAVPGTQFEIGVRASQGEQSTPEQRLVVFQGQG